MNASPEGLTPDLERRLQHLELIGNAEAQLAIAERQPRVATRAAAKSPAPTEQEHRYLMLRRRYEHEAQRTRKLALAMLCAAPLGVIIYLTLGELLPHPLGLACLLAAGVLIGLAVPSLYFANERLQELERADQN